MSVKYNSFMENKTKIRIKNHPIGMEIDEIGYIDGYIYNGNILEAICVFPKINKILPISVKDLELIENSDFIKYVNN